ncbi:MAG: GNAT family N-acetyltransferase [bacterium]
MASTPDSKSSDDLLLREMTAADAPGVADLVRRTYGDDYIHERIYRPDDFYADQEAGLHTSEVVIADNGEGEVVGHCAFTFHGPKVAEGGMAITDERYRGHGIASRMEANLMARIRARKIKWVMAEPLLVHTASQELIIGHSDQGAITGIRLKEFSHVDMDDFADHTEHGRISVAVGFIPLAEMQAHDVWIAPEYAEILEIVLQPVEWPRTIRTEAPGDLDLPAETLLTSDYDEEAMKSAIEVEVIGADLAQAVEAERDALAAKGAKFIEVHIPTNEPSAATASLIDHGFSFAGFLPEMRGHADLLLLQWIADPRIERDRWALLNEHLEHLADAIVSQAHLAAERR